MDRTPAHQNKLYAALRWVPILLYFVVKYLVFDNELTWTQQLSLIAFVVLAELALWGYRRRQQRQSGDSLPNADGTD
ncbi:hypothetical protein LEM8419_00947 [Neolewinella maritima]|uniref:Uncharacterized protein n=1 Tax=Neolewinella maritima TaxID=1383882 RepID=A0ABN8F074_9BACT|nr:hypothetical protein [Neolewinella maritima]CAH0999647.1 hypothetical protein LEM8419_00947 [Neolewinella maritima]